MVTMTPSWKLSGSRVAIFGDTHKLNFLVTYVCEKTFSLFTRKNFWPRGARARGRASVCGLVRMRSRMAKNGILRDDRV